MNLLIKSNPVKVLYPIQELNNEKPTQDIYLKVAFNKGTYIINYDSILYLKSESSYTMIYLDNGKKILSSKTLKSYSEVLPKSKFMRVHRSYIVPLSKIDIIYNMPAGVQINEQVIPVSKNFKSDLKDFFNQSYAS